MSTLPHRTRLVRVADEQRHAALAFFLTVAIVIVMSLLADSVHEQEQGVHFSDGVYTVAPTGADLAPGVYATTGVPGSTCRWWTTDAAGRILVRPDSAIDDIPPLAIRLWPSTLLHTDGCGTWRLVP